MKEKWKKKCGREWETEKEKPSSSPQEKWKEEAVSHDEKLVPSDEGEPRFLSTSGRRYLYARASETLRCSLCGSQGLSVE